MTRRRAVLVVPAAPSAKLEKGRSLEADEVVIDLEDAVVPASKDEARAAVAAALGEAFAAPSVAVRVNAIGTPWCHLDLAAVAGAPREQVTVVLPKVESAGDLAFADRLLAGAEAAAGRTTPVRLLALIETAAGLQAVGELARASARLDGLILGYADLAASLGRPAGGPGAAAPGGPGAAAPGGPGAAGGTAAAAGARAAGASSAAADWRFAQDALLVAARAAGLQAIDGPHLAIRDDEPFRAAVAHARALGYDGKWAIHPAQLDALRDAFTPTEDEVAEARETLAALERAAADGAGAVAAGDRMLDAALAVSARRVLARAGEAA